MTIESINWKEVAPKRKDWERLSADFKAAGLQHTTWINGVPTWNKPVDEKLVADIVNGKTETKKKRH